MKLAIMQPYLFPYIGYFQLVAAVDKFVFYDDVNFIKNGWINRNRLLVGGESRYFTAPLSGASPNLKINQVKVVSDTAWQSKLRQSLRHAYARAPHFRAVNDLVTDVITMDEVRISEIAKRSVVSVAAYLGLHTQFVPSSTIYANDALRGADRVLDICRRENASVYANLPGGRALYSHAEFAAAGIRLCFIDPRIAAYRQSQATFHGGLSIIDVLMFNAPKDVAMLLACDVHGLP